MIRKTAAIAITLGMLVAACQLVAGIERVDKDIAAADVTTDAGNPDPGAIPDPCQHARPPGKPSRDDDPTRELPAIVLAMKQFSLKDEDNIQPGFDLDGVCTCDTRPGSADGGASSCVRKGDPICDADGGVDNSFAIAAKSFDIGSFDIDKFAGVNESIARGRGGGLFFIRKYNGRANDLEVEVGLIGAYGVVSSRCPESQPDDGGMPTYSPGWCGDDEWTYAPKTMVGGFPIVFGSGYVHDYHLVIRVDRSVTVPFGEIGLSMNSPVFVATLVPLDEHMAPRDPNQPPTASQERFYAIEDGTIAGRVSATDLLSAAGAAATPAGFGQGYVCQTPGVYELVRGQICQALDVAQSPNLDFQPGYGCDAVSMSIRFSAQPARLGEGIDPSNPPNPCIAVDGGPIDSGNYIKKYGCD
ncbi:hypothetical protein AKJ09_08474 [Labilithrix luteola]|uniref:Lipoprotein n=1 Tax=Labilithrix luteola TaxID=1391654 RepID=A0A0K1Q7L7_9BACT|nr:hypothetical protein [Labilithrix luteola]AKV01811.1 hypothetical protein AKJ09_08474 [Labilithrix luteola]